MQAWSHQPLVDELFRKGRGDAERLLAWNDQLLDDELSARGEGMQRGCWHGVINPSSMSFLARAEG
jgi:hypothetical protein